MRRIVLMVTVALVAAAMMAASALPAFAQGQVERGPEHARSICSFSGLNDDPDEAGPFGGRTQSYGQLVKKGFLVPSDKEGELSFLRPGVLCNPNTGPSGPFEPHGPHE
jgi:hypothetical protein